MTNEAKTQIGVVAADSLRSMGLVAILEEIAGVQASPLKLEDVYGTQDLDLVLLAHLQQGRAESEQAFQVLGEGEFSLLARH